MIRPLLVALLWITSLANAMTPAIPFPVTEKGVRIAETQDNSYEAEIATLSTGDVVVVWFDSTLFQLQGRIFTDTNPTVGSPTFVIYQAMSSHSVVFNGRSRDLAALSHGGFMVAYEDGNELYCREFDSNGSPMGAATHVSNFNTGTPSHISDGHSILALGSGEVFLLFKGGTQVSYFKVGGTGFAEKVFQLQLCVFDMVEVSGNRIVIAYTSTVTDNPRSMIVDSSFVVAPGAVIAPRDNYLQIVFSSTYGRDPPLITLGMHSASASEFRLWTYEFVDPTTKRYESPDLADSHLAIGLGSKDKESIVVSFNKETFDYLDERFVPYSNSYDRSISNGVVTSVSAAQLGQGGWFAIFVESSSLALFATYKNVPEVLLSRGTNGYVRKSTTGIDTGGRVIVGRTSPTEPIFYQFVKDGVRTTHTTDYTSLSEPEVLGSLPNTDIFFVSVSNTGYFRILRITISTKAQVEILKISSNTGVLGKVCGNEFRVVVVTLTGKYTAYFGDAEEVELFNLGSIPSPNYVDFACYGEKNVIVYSNQLPDAVSYREFEFTEKGLIGAKTEKVHTEGSGRKLGTFSAHMFSDKSVLVFAGVGGNDVYSFRTESPDVVGWKSLDNYDVEYRTSKPSIAPSPVDDSIYVAFIISSPVAGASSHAVGVCHMDKFGTVISNSVNPIVNNYVLGYHKFPSLITTPTGLSLVYSISIPRRIIVELLITKPVALDSGPELSLSTRKGSQHSPESCSIGSDRVIIVWVSDSGGYSSIFGRIVETTEAPVGNTEFMISDPSSSHDQPSVACSEVGFYVTWQTSLASGVRVWVRHFNKDGVASPPQTVGESAGKDARPDVATDKVGDKYVVVWQSDEDASTFEDIHMVPFTTSGKGSEVVVHITTASTQKNPSVAMDGTLIVVVWQSYGQDGSRYGVYGRTYNSADFTSREPVEFLINTVMLGCQSFPEVALFSDSRFIVTWASSAALFNAMAAVFDSDSVHTKVVPDFRVNVNTKGNHRPSSICVFDDDSFVVSWNYYLSRDVQDAYFRKFSSDMVPATEDVLINSYTHRKQFDPTVAILNNIILVSWVSKWRQGESTWSVYSRAFGKLETRETIGATLGGRTFVMPTSRTTSDGGVVTFFLSNIQGNNYRYPALSKTAPDGTKTEVRGEGALSISVSDSIRSFDVSVVGESGFMVLREGTTYHFYEFPLDSVGIPTELSTSIPAVGVIASPRLAAEGRSEMAIVYRDGDDTVGASLFFQKYGDPLGTQVSLFPEMQSFTHYDFEFFSSGHYVLANSMGVSGTKLYLSVVSTAGVVLKSVAITGSGANAYSPKIDVSGDKVVVCYAQAGSVFAAVECQLYVVCGLGGDITIKKQGGTLETAMYAAYPFVGMSVVGTERFAVSGIMGASVFVRVFNFAFECIGAHVVADDVRNLAGTSGFAVARYQVSGLSVTYGVSEDADGFDRIIQWLLKTPFYSSIDGRVPTDPSVHPEYLGV